MAHTTEMDIVRGNSSGEANKRIDSATENSVSKHYQRGSAEINARIIKIEKEWDVERVLEMNASTLAFIGILLGAFVHPAWLFLPGIVLPFLFLHAVQGWCPPLPILRYFGVRTRKEIDIEKYSLKALRGDFQNVTTPHEAIIAAKR